MQRIALLIVSTLAFVSCAHLPATAPGAPKLVSTTDVTMPTGWNDAPYYGWDAETEHVFVNEEMPGLMLVVQRVRKGNQSPESVAGEIALAAMASGSGVVGNETNDGSAEMAMSYRGNDGMVASGFVVVKTLPGEPDVIRIFHGQWAVQAAAICEPIFREMIRSAKPGRRPVRTYIGFDPPEGWEDSVPDKTASAIVNRVLEHPTGARIVVGRSPNAAHQSGNVFSRTRGTFVDDKAVTVGPTFEARQGDVSATCFNFAGPNAEGDDAEGTVCTRPLGTDVAIFMGSWAPDFAKLLKPQFAEMVARAHLVGR